MILYLTFILHKSDIVFNSVGCFYFQSFVKSESTKSLTTDLRELTLQASTALVYPF